VEVRESIDLPAPPEEVFDLLLDVNRLGEWVTAHRAIVDGPGGALAVGSTFTQKLRLAGVSFKVDWEVTRLERPRIVEWQGSGPGGSDARVCYSLAANEAGARFDYVNEFRLPGGKLAQVAGRAVGEGRARREARDSLERLRNLLAEDGGRPGGR
jgi:carbon monoxide dehydrogenase subunit G